MRIAQIAPLIESVPPRCYGGTERIVSYLTEELVRQGHDVTLFASGDSQTSANLMPCCPTALRLTPAVRDPIPYYMAMLDKVSLAERFDVLHFHIDQFHFPIFNHGSIATVTTMHGRQDLPDMPYLYRSFPQMPVVSISNAQRAPIPDANFAGTVLHGLPAHHLHFNRESGNPPYLAFLGRISPEKRVDRAVAIAKAVGMPLKIAAKIDRVDEEYYCSLEPLLNQPGIEFIGEIDEFAKGRFLGEASALLFPIDWPEPFGLVMIEAMACGTPVLAFRNGSVSEVIDPGVTGMIVTSVDEAIAAMPSLLALDRTQVRAQFDERFSVQRMAHDYVSVYHALIDQKVSAAPVPGSARAYVDSVVDRSRRSAIAGLEVAAIRPDR